MRNLDADEYFESFLVAAVGAILVIRAFLALTGYPTVGGEALHVAHMLWGGLFMLVALLLLIGYLGRPAKSAAAFIGGVGWGTFIDELGKFLTHDNDYFFRPTFALIYVTFIVMYVVWEALHRKTPTRNESLANALELMLEAVRKDMDEEERRRALELLDACDPRDPVARSVRRAVAEVELAPPGRPGLLYRARHAARAFYRWLVQRRWFATLLVAFFVVHSVFALVQVTWRVSQLAASLALVAIAIIGASILLHERVRRLTRHGPGAAAIIMAAALVIAGTLGRTELARLGAFEWAELLSSVAPPLIVLVGVARLRRSRLLAYRTFKTAVLFIIFITQFFAFYHQQLFAVLGLLANIIVLLALRTMIHQEESMLAEDADEIGGGNAPAIGTWRSGIARPRESPADRAPPSP